MLETIDDFDFMINHSFNMIDLGARRTGRSTHHVEEMNSRTIMIVHSHDYKKTVEDSFARADKGHLLKNVFVIEPRFHEKQNIISDIEFLVGVQNNGKTERVILDHEWIRHYYMSALNSVHEDLKEYTSPRNLKQEEQRISYAN